MNVPYQIICLVLVICGRSSSDINLEDADEIKATVKSWADKLSAELRRLSVVARWEETKESFSQASVVKEDWRAVVKDLAKNISKMMKEKVEAVEAIKNHVELLSYNRKPPINVNSSYDFYDSDDLLNTNASYETEKDALEEEYLFRCSVPQNSTLRYQNQDQSDQPYESLDSMNMEYDSFNYKRSRRAGVPIQIKPHCEHIMFIKHPKNYTKYMKMEYNPHFDAKVNLNHSIIKVTPGVHNRSTKVINGIRMSEALDLTFKDNYKKDATLTYQYFGSKSGYLRFYPAMKWSEDAYDKTYDFRLRSWYVESMSSAKDIIILLDRSGSMTGKKRNMSTEIVNTILDTLTDNDYVNIYTFTNTTEPLVECFDDNLVQANEENLRLFREKLLFINDQFCGDISLGLEKAFPILNNRRARRGGLICNQAIMLITEGLDYKYNIGLFDTYNNVPSEKYYRPIRIFTYLIGTESNDAQRMKWIACANMGYYVNITVIEEVREKVLKYLEVLSRPINLSQHIKPEPAWTALYVHLADRRLSNWLWKKTVGIRQRQIFIDYGKEEMKKHNNILEKNHTHFRENTEHDFAKYVLQRSYKYLTSVSLPVYDKRTNKTELLGVAGVDVPLDYIKQLTQPHRIGVNGYPFIITNNGYVLDHPDHRTVFGPKDDINKINKTKILKPTFNRVDFTEVEISDNTNKPRKFDPSIIELREKIVLQQTGHKDLQIRAPVDNMKRVMLQTRRYYYTPIHPFSLVIALPKTYGFNVIKHPTSTNFLKDIMQSLKVLKRNKFWKIHPKWQYTCNKIHKKQKIPEHELLYYMEEYIKAEGGYRRQAQKPDCNIDLFKALLADVKMTEWFTNNDPVFRSFTSSDGLVLTFLATHAGLTRWKNLIELDESDATLLRHFASKHSEAADEVYYRRSAEMNFDKRNANLFLYSVPFEDYDKNNTKITASNVIFHEKGGERAPVAAVGFQIYHRAINAILNNFTCNRKSCKTSCVDSTWTCYVVDNDGYIILANDTNLVSKSLGEIEPKLMHHLVKDEVFKEITLFDYQDICYVNYTYYNPIKPLYGPTTVNEVEEGVVYCERKQKESEESGRPVDYRTKSKCKTIGYLRKRIQKTIPTPCDNELMLYNSLWKRISKLPQRNTDKNCNCPYITEPIRDTNLMLIVVEGTCCAEKYIEKKFPREINYNNTTLPCYIATMNNFTKRHYAKCIVKNKKEFVINVDNENCGGEGITPLE